MKTKTCTKCNKEKSLTEFNKDKTKKDGYRPSCKMCVLKYQKKILFKNG